MALIQCAGITLGSYTHRIANHDMGTSRYAKGSLPDLPCVPGQGPWAENVAMCGPKTPESPVSTPRAVDLTLVPTTAMAWEERPKCFSCSADKRPSSTMRLQASESAGQVDILYLGGW